MRLVLEADRRETGCPKGSNGAKRSGNIAESLEGDITIEPDWLTEHVGVMPKNCVRIDPEVWAQLGGFMERREAIRTTYQTFDGRVSEYPLRPYQVRSPLTGGPTRARLRPFRTLKHH